MPVNLVRDADVTAISLVKRGANRKRFFLLKSQPEGAREPEQLPAGRIVKAADWSAAYVVVAEPGAHEDPGMLGDQSVEDRWANAEEIRKAAHRWMRNGGLINRMHEDLEPYGQVVENFIAPEDFAVGGETILKGSWVIGIEPTAEGREAIEKGEFTGVSIEGLAIREPVEKADKGEDYTACDECLLDSKKGTIKKASGRALPGLDRKPGKSNWVDEAGGLPDLIDRAARHLHFERGRSISAAIATAVNWAKKGCATGRAFGGKVKVSKAAQARMCKAVAEWEAKKKRAGVKKAKGHAETEQVVEAYLSAWGSTGADRTVGAVEKTLLRKVAEKLGITAEEVEAINKADQTFGEIIARREFEDALPEAFQAFREAVSRAFFPPPDSDADPVALISESCDEFKSWALDMLAQVPVEKAARAEALGVELDSEGSTQPLSTKDGDMSLSDKERQEFDELKKSVEKIDPDKLADSFAARLAKALGAPADDETPTAESIAKQAKALAGVTDESELKQKVAKIEADIAKLAEGTSSQDEDPEPVSKEANAEAIKKAFEREGVNPDLIGVFS